MRPLLEQGWQVLNLISEVIFEVKLETEIGNKALNSIMLAWRKVLLQFYVET